MGETQISTFLTVCHVAYAETRERQ